MGFIAVINTIALARDAHRPSSGHRPYHERAWLLRNVLLPWYQTLGLFDEIIVVGAFETGDGYTYVPCEAVHHSVADALIQRQRGLEASRGSADDWLLFQHDDHLWDPKNAVPSVDSCPVLSPSRWTRARQGGIGEPLNDGHSDGYVNGHACLMRRWAATKLQWATVAPVFTWDIEMTRRCGESGIRWRYAPEYKVYDVERGSTPWM